MHGENRKHKRARAKGCKTCACRIKQTCNSTAASKRARCESGEEFRNGMMRVKKARELCKGSFWIMKEKEAPEDRVGIAKFIQRFIPHRLNSQPRNRLRPFQRKRDVNDNRNPNTPT